MSEPKEFHGLSRSHLIAMIQEQRRSYDAKIEELSTKLKHTTRERDQARREWDSLLNILRLSWKESDALKERLKR